MLICLSVSKQYRIKQKSKTICLCYLQTFHLDSYLSKMEKQVIYI